MQQFESLNNVLDKAHNILIVGNSNISADETAGIIGLYRILSKSGKKVSMVTEDAIPNSIKFLPNSGFIAKNIGNANDFVLSIAGENIKNFEKIQTENGFDLVISSHNKPISKQDVSFKRTAEKFDVIITINTEKLSDLGKVFTENREIFQKTPIINVSNNIGNEYFGKINIVDGTSLSVCEILYKFFIQNENFATNFDKDLATILLSGIISETGSFCESMITPQSFSIASKLQNLGADQSEIINHIFKEKTFKNLKILGKFLTNFETDEIHRMSWTFLQKNDFESVNCDYSDIDNWVDQVLKNTKNSDIFTCFIQNKNDILGQIRTKNKNEDLSSLEISRDYEVTKNKFGFNLKIKNQEINECLPDFLQKVANFCEKRLKIEPVQIEKYQINLDKNDESNLENLEKKSNPSNINLENLPFEVK